MTCYECVKEWELNAPDHGHEPWCEQGADECRWLVHGLSQFEKDMDYILLFGKDGQPSLVHKDDLREAMEELHGDS